MAVFGGIFLDWLGPAVDTDIFLCCLIGFCCFLVFWEHACPPDLFFGFLMILGAALDYLERLWSVLGVSSSVVFHLSVLRDNRDGDNIKKPVI